MTNNIYFIANWKMYGSTSSLNSLNKLINLSKLKKYRNAKIIYFPPFTLIQSFINKFNNTKIYVGGQNCHHIEDYGSFTGAISPKMLKELGCKYVILGHSERRAYYNETDAGLKQKVKKALTYDMEVVFCFGEELDQRKAGSHFEVVQSQLETVLFDLNSTEWSKIILAYEPVWAIGTGETASPEQAQDIHAYIRGLIASKYDEDLAHDVSILYGGSVKPANASAIFSQPDVDGGLIGGASLNAEDFIAIIQSI